jgi:murein DD-endopeptidase MepM/ murein hydrolase activator NlpD
MMTGMDNRPLEEFPAPGQENEPKPGLFRRIMDGLARFGLSETALRVGTNVLAVLVILGVVGLMQGLYRGVAQARTSNLPAVSEEAALPDLSLLSFDPLAASLGGIPRQAKPYTTIPSRPRLDVITYTVQAGDSVFAIAENFGLKPSTILFANYATLKDTPHSLRPGQELNILPVDGAYYQWVGGGAETLTGVAEFFGVEAEDIVNFPGNHLDPDTIGDFENPNIAAGTWLVIPGGTREFTSWSAPIGVTRSSPATTRVLGPGACGAVSGGQIGFGTFIWPTPKHYLSGTPFRPDINHPAIDIGGSLGDAVVAMDAGVIVYAGWNDWGYGNLVVIDHGETPTGSWQSLYAHLNSVNVVCGQNVGQGELIGLLGSTGNSTGPHLHLELMSPVYGKVDPLNFLPPP